MSRLLYLASILFTATITFHGIQASEGENIITPDMSQEALKKEYEEMIQRQKKEEEETLRDKEKYNKGNLPSPRPTNQMATSEIPGQSFGSTLLSKPDAKSQTHDGGKGDDNPKWGEDK